MLTVGSQRSMELPVLALQDVYHVLLENLLTLQEPHHVKSASLTLFLNILRALPVCSAHEEHIRLAHGRKSVAECCSRLSFITNVLTLFPISPPTLHHYHHFHHLFISLVALSSPPSSTSFL